MWIDITEKEKKEFNAIATHPLQSYEWGEFRKATGVTVIRRGLRKKNGFIDGFTLTLHKVPKTKYTIGYLPKGLTPTKIAIEELKRIGKINDCIFIQLEPNILTDKIRLLENLELRRSFHPLFTKFTFVLDISKSEEELQKNFHPKTRYNIRVATKHGVEIVEENTEKSFAEYLLLTKETTARQKFYAHTPSYHKKLWETLRSRNNNGKDEKIKNNKLTAHLLRAIYTPEDGKQLTLASWILFVFHDTLYYPYGASSSQCRNVMASNLIMWEAIRFGKRLGLKKFDMWGALGKNPDPKDSWYGFHKFKEGYGAIHTEFAGSFDLVINSNLYQIYKVADKLRWTYLRIKKLG